MELYQLRFKNDQSLEDLLGRLVDAVYDVLFKSDLTPAVKHDDRSRLTIGLKQVFSRFIVRYEDCGLQIICEENIKPAQWNVRPSEELSSRSPWC